jgi:hypothetical protein
VRFVFVRFVPQAVFLGLLAAISQEVAHAYPSFIGYGYTSCQVCHFNAFGNGPLTDYGRALGANTITSKGPWSAQKNEEELALASGFLGRKRLPYWFRPAIDFRGLALAAGLEQERGRRAFIPMQADASLTIQSESREHWASMTVGYLPERNQTKAQSADTAPLISREHYLAYKLSENKRIFVGMMDIPFGIRTPDHTAYSRSVTQLQQNDQSHSIILHKFGEEHEMGLALLLGNLFQESSLRQMGASSTFEYDVWEKVRIGHSHLYTRNNYRSRLMNALHARIGVGEGSAVLMEVGGVWQKTKIPSSEFKTYGLIESMVRLRRGLHFILIGEFTTPDTFKPQPRIFSLGPALQYFPMNRVELRLDLKTRRTINASNVEEDSTNLMGQLHVWF